MCYFITVAVHEDDLGQLHSTLPERFRLHTQDHPQLRAMLPPGFVQRYVTERDAECSCGLHRVDGDHITDSQNVLTQFIKRKHKTGWSEAKIERAAAPLRLVLEKAMGDDWVGIDPEIAHWLRFLGPQVRGLFLLIHNYGGGVDTERLKLTRARLSFTKLCDRTFVTPEDVLLELS